MGRRPPLALLSLVFGLLGLLLGLGDFGRLMRFPVERFDELRRLPPTPRSVFWVEGLRTVARSAGESERLFIGVSFIFLIGALLLLGGTLSPRFRLLKGAAENPGEGLASHVDLRQMARVAVSVALTLLLLGALSPFVAGTRPTALTVLLGGLPAWVRGDGPGNLLLVALVLMPTLWWLWGPRGPLFPAEGVRLRDVLLCGFLAAGAALPAFLILFAIRSALEPAGYAFSLADRTGWMGLIALALLLPVAACLYLALISRFYAPAPVHAGRLAFMAFGAVAGIAVTTLVHAQTRAALRSLDVGVTSVAERLGLAPSELQRYAYLLAPSGRVEAAATLDGMTTNGEDQINSHPEARVAVREFLYRRKFRTTLAFGAFSYLDGCYALDWNSSEALKLELEMLEKAPSPVVPRLLVEKLGDCSTSPGNRAVLDRIADPAVFAWPEPEGSRRLGAAYARFGDMERARAYLLRARLSPQEQQSLLGGISPLADGVVRGRLSIRGKHEAAVRVGLVSVGKWSGMIGFRRPYSWRDVLEHTHTDAQGRFQFRHIPQGRYVLVLTGGEIGRLKGFPSAVVHPAVVEIDRFRPVVELKPIDIRVTQPTGVPLGTNPETTV